ncbi:GtrA family protein [Massilia sp. METH4]|uniref:GtrA family protein n=1 Tax=Massilia sp. METH4 TaxID=3123041 RepID=UPI0030D5A23E
MRKGGGLRFLLAGGLNTAVTYLLYLGLLPVAGYQASYAIAFVTGIAISYVLGRVFVFQAHQGYRSVLMLPLVYLVQYAVGAAVVWAWIDVLHQHAMLAPAIAIAATLPLTYFLSKLAFVGKIR